MATTVGDRGDHPRRKVKYSDMIVEKSSPSGGWRVTNYDGNDRNSQLYMGYTKKQAMKRHKDNFEGR